MASVMLRTIYERWMRERGRKMTKIHLQAAVRLQREVTELEKELKKKRKWVSLTDEEITEIRLKMFDAFATNYEAYRAIEAKLREKNT